MGAVAEVEVERDFTEDTSLSSNRAISAKGVLDGVHFCGMESAHGYGYTSKALQEAVSGKLYDNVDVYIDHAVKGTKEARSQKDKIGYVVPGSYQFIEGKGIAGSIQLNTAHPFYGSVKWWIENAPKKFGMSHVIGGLISESQNKIIKVSKVKSLDLVSDPATTQGAFMEGMISDAINADKARNKLSDTLSKAWSLIYDVTYPTSYSSSNKTLTDAEKADKILPIVKDLIAELNSFSSTQQESKKDEDDMKTPAELKEKHPDLYKLIVSESKSEGAKSERELLAKIDDAVKDIPANKRTKLFMKSVRESLEAGEDVKDLIDEHKALIAPTETQVVEKTAAEGKVADEETVVARGVDKKKVVVQEAKKLSDDELIVACGGKPEKRN